MPELHCFTKDSPTLKPTGKGALNGLTFVLKDLCAVKGHVSSFGHAQWRKTHEPAHQNSYILTKLLAEGAELAGTVKMDQLAFSIIGNVGEEPLPVNPNYPERFCGGSSSGSASSVAGGLVDFAVGSDTGGSVRVPAAACGVYGIRTTYGLISTDGVIPLAPSADVIGFFARSAEMLKKVTEVFSSNRSNTQLKKLLVPIDLSAYTSFGADAIRDEAIRIAEKNNLIIEEVDIKDYVSEEGREILGRNQNREIWNLHGEWVEQNKSYLAEEVQARLDICKSLAADDGLIIQADKDKFVQYGNSLRQFIGNDSVLCLPILPVSGPNRNFSHEEILEFRRKAFRLIAPSSVSGLPQISFPIKGVNTNIGLIGPKFSDTMLINLFC